MPMIPDSETASGPRFVAHGSAAIEIDWCLSAAHRSDRDLQPPALFEFFDASPEVAESVRTLWRPEETLSYPGYLELSALAHHGGLLYETDGEVLVSKLEALCADAPTDLAFAAEAPSDAERLRGRLQTLRHSPKRRRHYAQVIGEVWSALRPVWEAEGRALVASAVSDREALIRRRPSIDDFATQCCTADRLRSLAAGLGPRGEVAIIPAFFSRKGLIADLPGVLIIGVRAEQSGAAARARTELLARHLKAVADPTRLAILDALARQDLTISELATMFSVAQPTVSNHVKQLRDAGIVTHAPGAGRRLTVRQERVEAILDSLRGTLKPQQA